MAPHIPDFPKALFGELETEKLQHRFLESLMEFQNVDRGSLWIRRPDGYHCIEAMGPQSERIRNLVLPVGKPSIVGWVIENGEMTIAEPGKDKRHFKEAETDLDVKSTLILCYPLVLKSGEVYGAVEIIDTAHGGSRLNLTREYLELLEEFVAIGSIALGNALAFCRPEKGNPEAQKAAVRDQRGQTPLIGKSAAFQAALETARNYARTDFPVCLTGESGTGKELFAREIHRLSTRKNGPFLVQNVSAIPDTLLESELFGYRKGAFTGADRDKIGLFEAGGGGTVFLDEIGDMPLSLQARILRVLQENEVKPLGGTETRTVDVRVISATNRGPQPGYRRRHLPRRLVLPLKTSCPCACRPCANGPRTSPNCSTISSNATPPGCAYRPRPCPRPPAAPCANAPSRATSGRWENLVRYLLATAPGPVIEPGDIPSLPETTEAHRAKTPGNGAPVVLDPDHVPLAGYNWEDLERAYALALMEKYKWNVTKAAKQAGVNRSTFDSRLRKLGIRKE